MKNLYYSPMADELVLNVKGIICTSDPWPIPGTGGEGMDDPESLD